ncbi:MAG TPA: transporter, partial [Edaphobacter sp.]|nr:transporter [Edaphobacter sp.]
MLIQVFRVDATRQITPSGSSTWNYGAGRGLNLIPGFNSEFDVYNPPYIQHNTASARDGFGDVGFLYKYRILSANHKQGDYAVSMQLAATVPTGTYTNGSTDASIAPTLLAGKGFGKFDVISSLGGNLPAANTIKLGRSIAWNTTLQYHLGKYLWPEIGTN